MTTLWLDPQDQWRDTHAGTFCTNTHASTTAEPVADVDPTRQQDAIITGTAQAAEAALRPNNGGVLLTTGVYISNRFCKLTVGCSRTPS